MQAALAGYPGLQARTAEERAALSAASARQGLRTLGEISTLLLVAAALAVASALSATIWQRRARLAALKIQGYDAGQLWRAVLLESVVTIGVGVCRRRRARHLRPRARQPLPGADAPASRRPSPSARGRCCSRWR